MPNEFPHDVRQLWQTQEVQKVTITIDEIQRRAARFERRIRRRNIREYVVAALIITLFAWQAVRQPGWRASPQYLLIAGVLYAMFQLHQRASARSMPAGAALTASLRWHRKELERQSAALRAMWRWYLLPFAPGLAASLIVAALQHRINLVWYICCFVFPAAFIGVWALNRRAAGCLDRRIEELRSIEEET